MQKRKFRYDLKIFLEPIFQLKKEYFQIFIKRVFDVSFTIGSVWFLQQAIKAIELQDPIVFKKYLLIYGIVILFYYPVNYLTRHWSWNFYPVTKKFLDKKYIGKFIVMDNNQVEGIGTGRIIAIIEKGLQYWIDLLKLTMFTGLKSLLSVLFGFFYIATIIHRGILYIIFVLIILAIIVNFFNQKAISYRNKRRDVQHFLLRSFVRIIMSKFEILQSNKEDFEIKNLWSLHDKRFVHHKKTIDYMKIVYLLPLFSLGILTVFIVWMYGNNILNTGIGFGKLTALIAILGLVTKMVSDLLDYYRIFTKEWTHIQKVLDFFDNTKYIKGYTKGKEFKYKTGYIEIKNISFQYPQGDKVFKNFSLNIEGGKKTALVGVSGSGKTTLVKLIAAYLNLTKGEIIVDGQNIKDISLQSYYKNIGYLTQEASVFDGTVRENLMYSIDKKVSDEDIEKALRLAKCDFIFKFKNGFETEIGERGVLLSGGQRQRFAIAKIFLKNPEIIILDEPTSALDSFAEEKITQAMHNLYKNRTVIIVAHRLQTVKEADIIFVLDEGKIIEQGTHKSLIKEKGYYAKMLELQSGF